MRFQIICLFQIIGLAATCQIAGCTVGPDYQRPEIDVADQWHQQLMDGFAIDTPAEPWWQRLKDPVLDDLIGRVRDSNPDLHSAYWTLMQSRYVRDVAAGAYAPSVDGVGSYSRDLYSGNSFFGGGLSSKPFETYAIGFDAAWEPDLFGRIRRTLESAQASYEAQIENFRDVRVSLSAETARNYVELRTIQARIQLALKNIASQQNTLKLAEARFASELAPRLDVEQARLNLTDTQSGIPLLRSAEKAAINRLCVLIGEQPGVLFERLASAQPIPLPPPDIPIQVPAELLRQRPDIRRAERQLAAQFARIGVATAELYPQFSLNGSIGFQAVDFSDLTDNSSKYYSVGPSFRWNLFQGGRLRNQIKIAESQTRQFYWHYQTAVLAALEEVENAMTDYVQERRRQQSLRQSVEAAAASVELVTTQYKNGLTTFQDVLVLQRSQLLQEDKLAQSEGQVVQHLIRLYKALGGWEDDLPDETATAVDDGQDTSTR